MDDITKATFTQMLQGSELTTEMKDLHARTQHLKCRAMASGVLSAEVIALIIALTSDEPNQLRLLEPVPEKRPEEKATVSKGPTKMQKEAAEKEQKQEPAMADSS